MAQQLFVRDPRMPDNVHGPISAQKLRDLAKRGKLKPSHEVSLDRERWVPACKVKPSLFPETQAANSQTAVTTGPVTRDKNDDDTTAPVSPAHRRIVFAGTLFLALSLLVGGGIYWLFSRSTTASATNQNASDTSSENLTQFSHNDSVIDDDDSVNGDDDVATKQALLNVPLAGTWEAKSGDLTLSFVITPAGMMVKELRARATVRVPNGYAIASVPVKGEFAISQQQFSADQGDAEVSGTFVNQTRAEGSARLLVQYTQQLDFGGFMPATAVVNENWTARPVDLTNLPDAVTNPKGQLRRFVGSTDSVLLAVIAADDQHAFSASKDGAVRQWDLHTGQVVRERKQQVLEPLSKRG